MPGIRAADMQESLLGAGREKAKQVLTQRIQAAADRQRLGVEVVFLGVQGIHPPTEVAAEYEGVVGAVQEQQALVLYALAVRNEALSGLAGTVAEANRLYEAYQTASLEGDAAKREELGRGLDEAFRTAGGQISSILSDAKAYAYRKARTAQAMGLRFNGQVKAFHAAAGIYDRHLRLQALNEALKDVRKFAVLCDPNDAQTIVVDLQEKLMPSIYDGPGPLKQE